MRKYLLAMLLLLVPFVAFAATPAETVYSKARLLADVVTACNADKTYTVANINGLAITTHGELCISGTISASSSATATAAAPLYVEGTSNPFSQDLNGNLRINCITGCAGGSSNNNADNVAAAAANGNVRSYGYVWDGSNWDRWYGDSTNGAFANIKTSVLPTGASTAAKQPVLGTAGTASADVITIQGITSMTPLLVTPAANSAINLAQVAGTTIVNGGVAGSQSVGGTVATNVAINANPLNLGAQAVSSENTAVTTARQVQLVADLVGKLIVMPYANPENLVSGVITSAMTGTTSTSLIAAPAAGLRNYITHIVCSNAQSDATKGTDIVVQDGNGGTTIYFLPAAAVYGGASMTLPAPLRQPTTATAIYVANVTTGASTKCAASGYKGA